MYKYKYLSMITAVLLIVFSIGCTVSHKVTHKFTKWPDENPSISVGEITDAIPDDVETNNKPTLDEINYFRYQLDHRINANQYLKDGHNGEFTVNGTIIKFRRGSVYERQLIGWGAGAIEIVAYLELVDKSNGEVIFAGNFRRSVTDAVKADFEVFDIVAKDFVKALQKNYLKYKSS